ncbi:MAG: hypothetical protein AAF658_01500, partial [Myxococcota bacterium]
MTFDRRRFLGGLFAAGVWPVACGREDRTELWLSAQGDNEAEYGVAFLVRGELNTSVLHSGFRGHDLAQSPTHRERVVMFGRRPGRFG